MEPDPRGGPPALPASPRKKTGLQRQLRARERPPAAVSRATSAALSIEANRGSTRTALLLARTPGAVDGYRPRTCPQRANGCSRGDMSAPRAPGGAPAGPGRRVLLWFRRDLRLADNPALVAALAMQSEVVRSGRARGRGAPAPPPVRTFAAAWSAHLAHALPFCHRRCPCTCGPPRRRGSSSRGAARAGGWRTAWRRWTPTCTRSALACSASVPPTRAPRWWRWRGSWVLARCCSTTCSTPSPW